MQTPSIVHKGMYGVLDVFGLTVEFRQPGRQRRSRPCLAMTSLGSTASAPGYASKIPCPGVNTWRGS